MRILTKFYCLAFLLVNVSLFAQTTLVVTSGSATLDGVIQPGEYTSTPLVTTLGVTLYAMDDGNNFYLAATWSDATENIAKKQWFFDGTNWTQSGDEDRIAFIFDMGQNDPDGASCLTMCHGDGLMWTNVGKVDVWHWKSARGNAMGFADDKYFNEVLGGDGGRHGDPGTSAYSDNGPVANLPEFMAISDPGANVDFLVNSTSIANFDPYNVLPGTHAEATAFDQGAGFSNGNVIPGYVLRTAAGDRGNVMSAGKWDNGTWTVEFKRVNSGTDNDFWVPSGGTVEFTHEIFDNTGGGHPNDGFDPTLYTLDFTGITDVNEQNGNQLPESYSLSQNYPNPFNPTTTISFSLPVETNVSMKIFDLVGNEVKTLLNEKYPAGSYSVEFDAANLPSGVYFYQIEAGSFIDSKKLVLLK